MMQKFWAGLEEVGRLTLGALAVCILSGGLFLVTLAAVELAGAGFGTALLTAILSSAAVFVLTGAALVWRAMTSTSSEERLKRSREQEILDMAESSGGDVTVAELALKAPYSVDEVREQLDAFVDEGVADLRITDEGREVYVFPEFTGDRQAIPSDEPLEDEIEAVFREAARSTSESDEKSDAAAHSEQKVPVREETGADD